jgi:ligand-binding sensor domain-containing protein
MKYYFCAIISLFTHSIAISQIHTDAQFDVYSTEYVHIKKGLSQNTIQAMAEDNHGFLWLGTWDGLNRFDGYEFKVYKAASEENTNALSNESINCLYVDSHGQLWIGTEMGLNLLNPSNTIFRSFLQDTLTKMNSGENTILSITEASDGSMWIGTNNGLYVFHQSTEEFSFISFPSQVLLKKNPIINTLYTSKKSNSIWVGTNMGLYRFHSKTKRYKHYPLHTNKSNSSKNITVLKEDKQGVLWIGTDSELFAMRVSNETITNNGVFHHEKIKAYITDIYEDNTGNIWLALYGQGIIIYSHKEQKFLNFGNQKKTNAGISSSDVLSIIQTRNGSMWIGTWRGLNKFTPGQFRFIHISEDQSTPSLNSAMVWSFLEVDENTIWIGTDRGINVFDRQLNRISHITKESNHPIGLKSNRIRSMIHDSSGNYWIGTIDQGLICYHPQTQKSVFYGKNTADKTKEIVSNSVWHIIEDKTDSSIWVASNMGLSRIMPDGSIIIYEHDPANIHSLNTNQVYSIFQDSRGQLWFSTFSGVNLFHREKNQFFVFGQGLAPEQQLATQRILCVYEDSGENIWFGTMGEGAIVFNPISGEMFSLTNKDGLANNTVYDFIEDDNGFMWITTNEGISKVNLESFHIWNFDARDGVQSNEFNQGAALKLSTGEILLGGMNGFNLFNPAIVQENTYNPHIFITKFSVLNNEISDFLPNNDSIFLSWRENFFSFEFSSLDYTNPKKIKYSYKLAGFDNEWTHVSSDKRFADYTNVPPGRYKFHVKATNSDGLWSENELIIHIKIKAPFWKTLWFKIVSAIILTFLIWFIVYSQIRKIRKKQELEKKIFQFEKNVFELQQKVLHLQMNPHFLFNSLNSIQSFILKHEAEPAINYLGKFSKLMRLILHTSQSANVVLTDEIQLLKYYLEIESLRFNHIFKFNIHLDPNIDEEFIAIPSHMVQPLVENSIKHGLILKNGDGQVNITFKQFETHMEIIVDDNGIGRKMSAEIQHKKSIQRSNQGIAITRERLKIVNKQQQKSIFGLHYIDKLNPDNSPQGTTAILKTPYIEV